MGRCYRESYCSVLVDNNNCRPICRLWFNGKVKKYLGVFDAEKNETKIHIVGINSIFEHADLIPAVAKAFR